MATIKASRTEANLHFAFATETLANRRYLAYAERAEADGHTQAAALFRTIAERRSIHAQRHLEALEPCGAGPMGELIGDTACNVRAAIMNEVHECSDLYPGMARKAHQEGLEEIAQTLQRRGCSHTVLGPAQASPSLRRYRYRLA